MYLLISPLFYRPWRHFAVLPPDSVIRPYVFYDWIASMWHERYLLVILMTDSTPLSKSVTLFFASPVSDQVETNTSRPPKKPKPSIIGGNIKLTLLKLHRHPIENILYRLRSANLWFDTSYPNKKPAKLDSLRVFCLTKPCPHRTNGTTRAKALKPYLALLRSVTSLITSSATFLGQGM